MGQLRFDTQRLHFQRGQRKLTPEEIEEFICGDPAGVEVAPAGIDRAIRLPYKHILPPESVIIGTHMPLPDFQF